METPSFEQALERLEAIVAELEKGQLPLERSLEAFEEGVHLSRQLMERLEQAEERARVLVEKDDGGAGFLPFEEGEDDSEL